jgi:hypothetical protein
MNLRYSWLDFMTELSYSSERMTAFKKKNLLFTAGVIKSRNIRKVGNAECARMNRSLYKYWHNKCLN